MEKRLEIVIDPRRAETGANAVVEATRKIITAGDNASAAYKKVTEAFIKFSATANQAKSNLNGSAFTAIKQEGTETSKILGQVSKEVSSLTAMLNSMNKQLSSSKRAFNAAQAGAVNFTGTTEKIKKGSSEATSAVKSLHSAMLSFALTVGGLNLGGKAIELAKMTDQYTVWQNKLAVVTDGTIDLKTATDDLLRVSMDSRSDMASTMDLYSKMTRVNQRFGMSQEDILRITETVNKSVAMSGASAGAAQGAVMQFAQALSGDFKNAAQELNSILEQTPALAQAIAEALGVTSDKLKEMAKDGEISTEKVLNGLLRISNSIDDKFNRSVLTLDQGWTSLTDSFTAFLGKSETMSGSVRGIAKGFQYLAKNLDEFEGIINAVLAVFGTITAIAIPAMIASLAMLSGTIGVVVGSIGAIAGAGVYFYELGDSIDSSGKAARDNITFIQQLLVAWKDLIDVVTGKGKDKIFEASVVGAMGLGRDSIEAELVRLGKQAEEKKAEVLKLQGLQSGQGLKEFFVDYDTDIERATKGLEIISDRQNVLAEALKRTGASLDDIPKKSSKVTTETNNAASAFMTLKAELDKTTAINADYYESINKINDADISTAEKSELIALAYKKRKDALDGLNTTSKNSTDKTIKDNDRVVDSFVRLSSKYSEVADKTYRLAEAKQIILDYAKLEGKSSEWVAEQYTLAANDINGLTKSLEDAEEAYKKIKEAIDPTLESTNELSNAEKQLNLLVKNKSITQSQMNEVMSKYKNILEGTVPVVDSVRNAVDKYYKEAIDTSSQVTSAMESGLKGMEDALVSFVTTGKLEFKSLVNSILSDIARIAIKQSITAPLANALSGVMGGMFGGIGADSAASIGGGSFTLLAKGGAFSDSARYFAKGGIPSLSDYSGTVVNKPTMFAAGGSFNNIMGEAGAEAILPLKRTSTGDLGVVSSGGNSPNVQNNITIVNNSSNSDISQTETNNNTGGKDIRIMISDTVKNQMASGVFDKTLKSRFGLQNRGG